jgi:hypothetical protein
LRIDRIVELSREFNSRLGQTFADPNGLSGFSLRFAIGDSGIEHSQIGQLIVETLVRERILLINITNTFEQVGDGLVEYRVLQADGKPLPGWLSRADDGVLMGEHPANVEVLELKVIAIRGDGSTIVREVRIDTNTGEILPLDRVQRSEAPLMFGDQLRAQAMLSEHEIGNLARALD